MRGWLRGASGRLYFGGPRGFNAFDPKTIVEDSFAPPIVVTDFRILNRSVSFDRPVWDVEDVSLSHSDSVFSFDFAALSFAGGNRYAYKLAGLHDEWIESTNHFVSYSKLAPGDYTFELKAANRHGVWSPEPLALRIHVDPPFWRRWWAYTFYVLVLGGIVLAYVRHAQQKVNLLQKQNRLKSVEREMELIGAVQAGFLPKDNRLVLDKAQVYGYFRPAEVCSGDWWWYELSEDRKLVVLVGDVTGHGAGPAMVTAAAAAAFRTQRDATQLPITERLELLHREVFRAAAGRLLMTISALSLDLDTAEFAFYSAGGLPAVLMSKLAKTTTVSARGMPLGSAEFSLGELKGTLTPGDRFAILTDGLPEIELASGRQLGWRRMIKMFDESKSLGLSEQASSIVSFADTSQGTRPQADDWTMALVEWA